MTATRSDPSDRTLIGLFGAGGFAREVMPLVRAEATRAAADARGPVDICFVEDAPAHPEVNAIPVLSSDDFLAAPCRERLFNIAIGDSAIRERIAERCLTAGARAMPLTAGNAVIYDHNEIGDGAILCAFTTITSNATIGRFFHANIYSYVAHDCRIGDFVTFAPRVHCNGNVHVGDHAYIGTSAIIRQGKPDQPLVIGKGAVVGMGAVVTKDVPAGTTVVGNPAQPLKKI